MKWLEVRLDTNHAGLESAEAFLSSLGIDDLVIDDADEFREFAEANRPCWDETDPALRRREEGPSRLTFYLEADEAGFARLAEVRMALSGFRKEHPDCGSLLLTLDTRQSEDWENNWKQFYRPLRIGKRLLVVPAWEQETPEPGDAARVRLVLDPGLTFGTGAHATTRLCLTALEGLVRGGERVLDLGCGSGILSIAALKLGAGCAAAVDIDDACRTAARENAALNGIDPLLYDVRIGDLLTDEALAEALGGGYDLILANIVSDVILALAPRVRGLLAPGGVFLCSGIIDTRAEEVRAGLESAGLEVTSAAAADGWAAYTCRAAGD